MRYGNVAVGYCCCNQSICWNFVADGKTTRRGVYLQIVVRHMYSGSVLSLFQISHSVCDLDQPSCLDACKSSILYPLIDLQLKDFVTTLVYSHPGIFPPRQKAANQNKSSWKSTLSLMVSTTVVFALILFIGVSNCASLPSSTSSLSVSPGRLPP